MVRASSADTIRDTRSADNEGFSGCEHRLGVKDEEIRNRGLVDKILDKTGMKVTGKWTVQQAAEMSIAAPTIAAPSDSRYMSGLKEGREAASEIFKKEGLKEDINNVGVVDKKRLIDDVRQELYASKICS
ncbi:unnamed protein product [Fraxinus pennsylvanica]|uniref:phosphogluconate dehydrogenase (NADP(+)-dependent, decarboxylating) n=1 Tax=Fraxinus pennsylvanica TaxID=56036 RepID=A0AAD1YSV4_9LAMI|nr:unnamed protein product [Fraxinus pennsylvanica]